MKYPKEIQKIIDEAPIPYAILLLMDWKNGKVDVQTAQDEWKLWKKNNPERQ